MVSWLGLVWIVLGFLILVCVLLWWLHRKHDYKVRIRELTSDKTKIVIDTLGRIATDSDKIEFLRLWMFGGRRHRELPLPQKEAIDYDPKKKKKVVEAYYSPEEGYVYIEDKKPVIGFEPLTTRQRAALVNQIKKKEARKTQSWAQNIPLIIGLGAIVLLVAVIMIFAKDFIAPFHEASAGFNAAADKFDALIDKVNACEKGQQVVAAQDQGVVIGTPPG